MLFCILSLCLLVVSADIQISLALKLQNLELLQLRALEVSNPRSPAYGHHLSLEEVRELTSLPPAQFNRLRQWLLQVGAKSVELLPSGDVATVVLPSSLASSLSRDIANPSLRMLPGIDSVRSLIDVVLYSEVEHKQTLKQATMGRRQSSLKKSPQGYVATPDLQKTYIYSMNTELKGTASKNLQMVWGPGTFGVSFDDLNEFYDKYKVPASTSDVTIAMYQGTPGGDNWGEGTLDASYITSFAPGVATLVVNSNTSMSTEEGKGFGYAFLDELLALNQLASPYSPLRKEEPQSVTRLPHVLSLSLGSLSWDSCNKMCVTLSKTTKYTLKDCNEYMQTQRQVCMYDSGPQADRMNNELMKLASKGVSIFVATGDGGSHFSFEPFPSDGGIGDALNTISCTYNFPTFPSVSPWITGVGGIQVGEEPTSRPVAWSGSGSGFSWRFPMPDYQKSVVEAYLKRYGASSGFPSAISFNATNRAYPDVAAIANDVPLIIGGNLYISGGTSASTPTFAGIISLINDHRLNNGLPGLGFLNPRIYELAAQHPGEVFQDILEGNSKTACTQGFPAGVGWDPTTGLGSPIFPGLLKYLGSN